MTTLNDFTTEQLQFALTAIQERLDKLVTINDHDEILSGNCPEWEALITWKVQLTMALERSEMIDKISSN